MAFTHHSKSAVWVALDQSDNDGLDQKLLKSCSVLRKYTNAAIEGVFECVL